MSDDLPDELAQDLMGTLIKGMIAKGELDLTGLTNREATVKGIEAVYQHNKESPIFDNVTFIHAQSLVTKANKLYLEKEYDLSILTYATWCEHWNNSGNKKPPFMVALFRLHYPKLNNIKYAGDLDFNFHINI